jgi:hypothetical protein
MTSPTVVGEKTARAHSSQRWSSRKAGKTEGARSGSLTGAKANPVRGLRAKKKAGEGDRQRAAAEREEDDQRGRESALASSMSGPPRSGALYDSI